VGVALLFRYAVKAWVRWALPQVTAPGRVWGIEDLFFLVAYGFDLTHMTLIQKRWVPFTFPSLSAISFANYYQL
jgi:hypothetical protein